jgi:hypothetical protein
MTGKEFLQGWALLVAQPYGAAYRRESEVEQTQRRFWQSEFGEADKDAWVHAVTWWIRHEDHFPLIPELRAHVLRLKPQAKPRAPVAQLVHGTAIPVTQDAIVRFAERKGITVFEAVRRWEEIAAEQERAAS